MQESTSSLMILIDNDHQQDARWVLADERQESLLDLPGSLIFAQFH